LKIIQVAFYDNVCCQTCDSAGELWSGGGHVDYDGAGGEVAQQAGATENHVLYFRGKSEHGKHDIAVASNLAGVSEVSDLIGDMRVKTSATESAKVAPSSRNGSALAMVRENTVAFRPLATRCAHMCRPMTPAPTHPIRALPASASDIALMTTTAWQMQHATPAVITSPVFASTNGRCSPCQRR
jgi:hypothetical protein